MKDIKIVEKEENIKEKDLNKPVKRKYGNK